MVEDIVGCKWSLTVLELVKSGVHRPGRMTRKVPGLSTKVLNERLKKLLRYGIVEREVFAEVPPHVEYRLTERGAQIGAVLDQIAALDRAWETGRESGGAPGSKKRATKAAGARAAAGKAARRTKRSPGS